MELLVCGLAAFGTVLNFLAFAQDHLLASAPLAVVAGLDLECLPELRHSFLFLLQSHLNPLGEL